MNDSDFSILRDLLKDEATAHVETLERGRAIVLCEPGEYTLRITGVPDESIAFKADMFPAPENIFRGNRGECKRADYVVIASDGNHLWIVYVELKGSGGSEHAIKQQLSGARCLVGYCRAIVKEFWRERRFLINCAERFVSVRNIGSRTRPTQPSKKPRHDVPERVLKLHAPKGVLRFKQLI